MEPQPHNFGFEPGYSDYDYDRFGAGVPTTFTDADSPPEAATLRGVRQGLGALENPLTAALDVLIRNTEQTAEQTRLTREAVQAINERQAELARGSGFVSIRMRYRFDDAPARAAAQGIFIKDISRYNRNPVRFFSLVHVGADPLYISFGRGMVNTGDTAPNNFDLVIPPRGKIERYPVTQGLEAISIWSVSDANGILYVTAGRASELPGL